MKKVILLSSILLSFLPMVILLWRYEVLPDKIPVFVDLQGRPLLEVGKSYFSVLRTSIMGLCVQAVCLGMFSVSLPEQRATHQYLWSIIALLSAIKMGSTAFQPMHLHALASLQTLRTIVIFTVVVALVFLLYYIYMLFKVYSSRYKAYIDSFNKKQRLLISVSLLVYLILVILPILYL